MSAYCSLAALAGSYCWPCCHLFCPAANSIWTLPVSLSVLPVHYVSLSFVFSPLSCTTQTWLRAWAPLCSPSICLVIRYRNAATAFCFFGLIKWESMVSPKSKIFPTESKQQQQQPLFPWPCYSVLVWVFFLTNVFMWTWISFPHLNGSKSLIVFVVFRDVFVSKCKGLPVTDTHLLVQ